jgi:hypothetical protein
MNRNFYDYESMGCLDFSAYRADIMEGFAGTSVVQWQGKIERQLMNMLDEVEKGRNYAYADKVREFLKIWRANEITGSINRETLEVLKSGADILAVDQWTLNKYFSSLRDQLKVLIASEEQLPRGMEDTGNEPMAGGGGGGMGGPPMAPSFGPQEEPPGGGGGGAPPAMPGAPGAGGPEGGPEGGAEPPPGGEEGTPPGEGEAPGAEPGAPAPEEGGIETPEPEEMPTGRMGMA